MPALQVYDPDEDEIQRRIAAARQQGWKEEDIQRFAMVDRYQRMQQKQAAKAQSAAEPTKERTGLNSWLPAIGSTVGGILGGIGGSFLAPGAGTVAGGGVGAGAGGAFGEWLAQKLGGENEDFGKVAKEGAISGVLGAIPFGKVLGTAGRVLTKGTAALKGAVAGGGDDAARALAARMAAQTDDIARSGAQAALPQAAATTSNVARRIPVDVVDEVWKGTPVKSTTRFTGTNPEVGQISKAYEKMIGEGFKPSGIATNITRSAGTPMRDSAYTKAFQQLSDDYDKAVMAAKTRPSKLGAIDVEFQGKLAKLNDKYNMAPGQQQLPFVEMQGTKTKVPFTQESVTKSKIPGDVMPKAREEVARSGADELSHEVADNGNADLGNVAMAMATGGVIGKAGKLLGRFANAPRLQGERRTLLGRGLQNLSDETSVRQFRLTKTQLTDFAKRHNEDISTFLKRHNAVGMDPAEVGTKIVEPLQQRFDAAVKGVNTPIKFGDYAAAVQRRAQKLIESPATDDNLVGMNLMEELKNAQGKVKDGVFNGGEELNAFRRNFDKLVNYTTQQANPAKYSVNKHMADAAREIIQDRAPGIRQIGQELSKAHDFADAAFKQSQLGRGTNLVRLVPTLMAGAGGTAVGGPAGGIPAALAMYAATQGINSRFGQTAITKGLEKAAGFVDNPMVSGAAGNLTKQALGRGVIDTFTGQPQQELTPEQLMQMTQQGTLPPTDLGYGSSDEQALVQQMGAAGMADPQMMIDALYGGGKSGALESQMGGFAGQGGSPLGQSSADLFNAALEMAQAGNSKGAQQAMQMAEFAKAYEDTLYKRNSAGAGDNKLSQEQQKRIMGVDSADSLVNELETTMSKLEAQGTSGRLGGFLGGISGAIGTNPEARAYENQKGIIAFNLAKALQGTGSQLSDRDVKVINDSIPSLMDTPEERKLKIQRLRTIIGANRSSILNAPKVYDAAPYGAEQDLSGMDVANAFAY